MKIDVVGLLVKLFSHRHKAEGTPETPRVVSGDACGWEHYRENESPTESDTYRVDDGQGGANSRVETEN